MIKKKGDILKDLEKKESQISRALEEASEQIASLYYNRLIKNIRENKFGFTLSDSTIRGRLSRNNSNTSPLIDTGEYISNIVLDGNVVRVTEGIHSGSSLSFSELSHILEYGRMDKHIPPFPVWRNTYEEILPEIRKTIFKLIGKHAQQS